MLPFHRFEIIILPKLQIKKNRMIHQVFRPFQFQGQYSFHFIFRNDQSTKLVMFPEFRRGGILHDFQLKMLILIDRHSHTFHRDMIFHLLLFINCKTEKHRIGHHVRNIFTKLPIKIDTSLLIRIIINSFVRTSS